MTDIEISNDAITASLSRAQLTFITSDSYLLQIRTNQKGSVARKELEKVFELLSKEASDLKITMTSGSSEYIKSTEIEFRSEEIEDVSLVDFHGSYDSDSLALILRNCTTKVEEHYA